MGFLLGRVKSRCEFFFMHQISRVSRYCECIGEMSLRPCDFCRRWYHIARELVIFFSKRFKNQLFNIDFDTPPCEAANLRFCEITFMAECLFLRCDRNERVLSDVIPRNDNVSMYDDLS